MLPKQFQFFLDGTSCKQREDPKEYFLAIVAASLLKETKYYALSDQSRDILVNTLKNIAEIDPEFVLQTAYYVRNKLYIRSVTNFILAFASMHPKTKPFCKTYFSKTVLIPGDLIEVCKFAQILRFLLPEQGKIPADIDIRKQLKFTNCLQGLVKQKFKEFSLYQLGKQCSEASRKKLLRQYKELLNPNIAQERKLKRLQKLKAIRDQMQGNEDAQKQFEIRLLGKAKKAAQSKGRHRTSNNIAQVEEQKNVFDFNFLSMKDIVCLCHVREPLEVVDSIMSKKYPANEEQFHLLYPQGKYEAGHNRMSIPIPATWDRELSKKDKSKQQVWEELIQGNQVPYLALLRNLRNILKANVSGEAHQKVIAKLRHKKAVEGSKIFPLQYFSALRELNALRNPKPKVEGGEQAKKQKKAKKVEKKKPQVEKAEEEDYTPPVELIQEYQNSIEAAIQIAVEKNLDTISGVTYVMIDVSGSMRSNISGGKSYGSVNQCMTCAFVLGHMVRMKCENCRFYLFAAPGSAGKNPYLEVEFTNETLLQGIEKCEKLANQLCGSHEMIGQTIKDLLLEPKVRADNVVILSDMMVTQGFSEQGFDFNTVIKQYIEKVNPDARFFFMDISGYGQQPSFGDDLKTKNCFMINGMSDNVLKFISLAGATTQIDEVVRFAKELKEKQQIGKIEQEEAQIQDQHKMQQE